MKAIILAALISTAQISDTPRAKGNRGRAERKRFTQAELEEMFGDMGATSHASQPDLDTREPDFIRWNPDDAPLEAPVAA